MLLGREREKDKERERERERGRKRKREREREGEKEREMCIRNVLTMINYVYSLYGIKHCRIHAVENSKRTCCI